MYVCMYMYTHTYVCIVVVCTLSSFLKKWKNENFYSLCTCIKGDLTIDNFLQIVQNCNTESSYKPGFLILGQQLEHELFQPQQG